MAVIKILNSSKNFSAVSYNEKRVSNGEAKLLAAVNFPSTLSSASDYMSYLKRWSSNNTRIKKTQLHVVISMKGQDSPENLLSTAYIWLEKMGYSKNPYIIYYHNNTDNSHIHIVTTRVDEYGRKIDHNFEKKKSQSILNEINGIKPLHEFRIYISNLLKFSFSTKQQFLELCKEGGVAVNDKDGKISLSKNGCTVNISSEIIDFCSNRYYHPIDNMNKKSIQAKIFKYAKSLDKDTFIKYMKDAFGLKFIFYGKNDKIYGFTIIDYKNHSIYKGSEVFSLKTMNELLNSNNKSTELKYNLVVEELLNSNGFMDINEVNVELMKHGVYTNGLKFFSLIDDESCGLIEKSLSKRLLRNTRVNKILNDFQPVTLLEKQILSNIFHVKLAELERPYNSTINNNVLYYKNILEDLILQGKNAQSTLDNLGIEIKWVDNNFVLIDLSNHQVISNERIGINVDSLKSVFLQNNNGYDFGHNFADEYVGEDYEYEPEILLFDVVSGLLSTHASVGSGKRKKKH